MSNKLIKDYSEKVKMEALNEIVIENPIAEALKSVQIIRNIALTDDGISDKAKELIESQYNKYKFYHRFIENN